MYPAAFDYHRAASVDEAVRLLGEHPEAQAAGRRPQPDPDDEAAPGPAGGADRHRPHRRARAASQRRRRRPAHRRPHHPRRAGRLRRRAAGPARCWPRRRRRSPTPRCATRAPWAATSPTPIPARTCRRCWWRSDATVHLHGPGGARSVAARRVLHRPADHRDGAGRGAGRGRGAGARRRRRLGLSQGRAPGLGLRRVRRGGGGAAGGRRGRRAPAWPSTASTATPYLASAVTDALVGGDGSDAAIAAAVDGELAIAEPMGDLHASGEYRRHLAAAYGKRALGRARDRAG